MYARLCPVFGWTEIDPSTGIRGPFVLSDVYRYCGMIAGTTRTGRKTNRPIPEFDAVSVDGTTWLPLRENISLIPWE
jgi:hypothetical protein